MCSAIVYRSGTLDFFRRLIVNPAPSYPENLYSTGDPNAGRLYLYLPRFIMSNRILSYDLIASNIGGLLTIGDFRRSRKKKIGFIELLMGLTKKIKTGVISDTFYIIRNTFFIQKKIL